jgi:hypothetical protein
MRISGVLLAGLGLVALAFDLVEAGRLRDTGEWWFRLHRDSLQLAQPALERHVAPWLWDPVMLNILVTPAAALFGGLGLAVLLARRALR